MAVRDIKESKGFGIAVSDKEILEGIKYLGTKAGNFC